ncbi:MAG: hypothetical protein ACHRXM_13120 [Isosphaerales bacterium]
METDQERFVPKVHPLSRAAEPDDPMTLSATAIAGDPDVLIRAVIQEYAWMGWDAGQIAALFHDPFYPVLNGLLQALGEACIRSRIDAVFARYGVYRFRATVHEALDDSAPDVVQIGTLMREEPRHGYGP